MVTMRNGGITMSVLETQVAEYMRNGWTVVEQPTADKPVATKKGGRIREQTGTDRTNQTPSAG